MRYKIHLKEPHDKQASFRASSAKRKVIVAGRRGGKTTGVSTIAVEAALEGRRILEAAPTQDQTEVFWEECKAAFAEPIAAGVIYKHEGKRMMELPNGGRIRSKTAWDADTLRGDYADLLILDEYSLMSESAWNEVGAPMLLDNDGDAVFIFTPKRRNHAYKLYQRAKADDTGRWGAWHFTSHDNPHLSEEALAEITADMTDEAYKQEILAQFLEGEGQVFRNIPANMTAPQTTPAAHATHRLVAGVDWARQQDYTAISVGCATCEQEVAIDRFNKIEYAFQRGRLRVLVERWGVTDILAEENSIGLPNLEMLQRDGLPVRGFQTTASSKPPLIQNLALSLERVEFALISDPVWTAELEAYEQTVSATTGRARYSAPEGMHDDTVMARALMIRAAQSGGLEVF